MILPVLWSVEPFWRFRFGQVFEARLGYLAIDMESYSRNLQFESIPPRTTHVFFAYNPANRQLLKIWKRHYFIVENRLARWMSFTFLPVMENTRFYLRFPTSAQAADVLSHGHSVLRLTAEEEELGQELLGEMGIGPDDWFVRFHARDPSYLHTRDTAAKTDYRRSFRDTSITNMIPAMKWVTDQGV